MWEKLSKENIREAIRIDRAVGFVWKAAPGLTIAGLFFVLIQGLMPLLTLYLMKLIVDAVTFAIGAADRMAAFHEVALFIGLAALTAMANSLCGLAAGFAREAQALKVTDYISDILHAKSIEADLAYYENPKYFDTLHRAQKEGPYRPTRIVNGLMDLGRSGVTLLAMVGLLFAFHWSVAFVLFAAALPGLLVRLQFSAKLYHWQRGRTQAERMVSYYNWMLTGDAYAKEIRLFDLGGLFKRRFQRFRKSLRAEKLEISRNRSGWEFVAQALAMLAVFGCFIFIAYRTVHGVLTLGDMVMYYQAFQRGLSSLRGVLGGMADLYENNLFLSNLFEFLELESKVRDPAEPIPFPVPMKRGLTFDSVSFRYPAGRSNALDGVTLSIEPGEAVALVGENGSGKTTFVKLLCRLYDPDDGEIRIDNIDLRRFALKDARREMSVIFQDYARYHMTARENIWLGNIGLPLDSDRVHNAARAAGIEERVNSLSKGYETVIGRWFENGEELSAGEWQKIALARAFLREAQIIILDEPTSSLDPRSEFDVFRHFRSLIGEKTAVIISHRFSTVRVADRICVFEGGRIIESGPHEDLMKKGGVYAEMYAKQALHYHD